jgi:hypothetical protein
MKILGREPTLWISLISSGIVLLGTLGFHYLTGQQAALIVALINGIALAINAYAVRPISPVAFTYVVGAAVAVAASYGLNVNADQMASLNALVITTLALLTRGQVSPTETVITKASLDPVKVSE